MKCEEESKLGGNLQNVINAAAPKLNLKVAIESIVKKNLRVTLASAGWNPISNYFC